MEEDLLNIIINNGFSTFVALYCLLKIDRSLDKMNNTLQRLLYRMN